MTPENINKLLQLHADLTAGTPKRFYQPQFHPSCATCMFEHGPHCSLTCKYNYEPVKEAKS